MEGTEQRATLTARFEEGECFYAILSVKKEASAAEIRKAYYKLALNLHPDRVQGDDEAKAKAKDDFQTLGRIYETLSVEEKRKFYDETGSIEHDDFLASSKDKDWDEYWRMLFRKVTADDVESYAKSFKGSELEAADVKKAYVDHEGNMESIIDHVVLSSWDDEDRFRTIIDAAVEAGEVPKFAAYEASKKKKQSKRSTAATRRRKAQEEQEAKEAEELAQKLGLKGSDKGEKGGEDALKQLITKNKSKSGARFGSVIASLEAKYGGKEPKKGAAKAGGRQGKKKQEEENEEDEAPEISEEEFLAARKRLEDRKDQKEETGRSRKKRKVEEEEEGEGNEPTEEEFEQARKRLEQKGAAAKKTQGGRGAPAKGGRGRRGGKGKK